MAKLALRTTINEADYESLVAGLLIAEALRAIEVKVRADSQVVFNQVLGEYMMKGEKLKSDCSGYGRNMTDFFILA